ncbi:U-box domain-containing protein 54-like [Glycine soja]|uniref:U-box domain-containing protein 33 n=2 Tax=Glycine soja TaxID=3848 RepID=A0A445K2C4_GLYSO|nr:U-box domain-containing protein 54-like [Glycine soja]XP_028241957.1 U-box domain-containing protein 54-like [Glycine soja]RZC04869.1 U-box domain-containing protein 33 [Glycine soja]
MPSTRSWEMEHDECISCGGFIGFKRNQVIDCSSEIGDSDTEELFEINLKEKEPLALDAIREDCEISTVFSLDIDIHDGGSGNDDDVVYVAVGKDGDSSMEALSWALKHAVTPSATVCIVHVFPQVKLIPSPLGKIPRSHVNLEYVNMHLTQEKGKRKLLLQKFIDLCVDSKVKVEMKLIEGDNVAKTIVDLVGNLNIRKLVIGITKSNLRKSGSRSHNSIAAKVLKNAQESCDIKIICEGREVIDQMSDCTSPRSIDVKGSLRLSQEKNESRGFVPLKHFMPSSLWLFRSITKMR